MKKTLMTLLPMFFMAYLLSGCSSPPSNQDVGMVAGGVAGGVAGSALTRGSTAGTVAGAVGGAYVGSRLAN